MQPKHTRELRIYVDEAGRGPLAGPVVVWATSPRQAVDTSLYHDSKQLTALQRSVCFDQMIDLQHNNHCAIGIGRAEHDYIDQFGIIQALQVATLQAIWKLLGDMYQQQGRKLLINSVYGEDILAARILDTLTTMRPIDVASYAIAINQFLWVFQHQRTYKTILIDGNHDFWLRTMINLPIITIIKWDSKNPYISMASIIAKVSRDERMNTIADAFPWYGFASNKWYGTKAHRDYIRSHGPSPLHRKSFLRTIALESLDQRNPDQPVTNYTPTIHQQSPLQSAIQPDKPGLLLHICCAPDLTWPLHWLKDHFKLYLFRYNPNIHPRKEHDLRYAQFLKLVGLEQWDYEIVEDRYDPKEFFQAMYDQRDTIRDDLVDADYKTVLQKAGIMEERSDRCNPCYSMRLEQAAAQAAKLHIPYFTSTLLISPKKKMDKLFRRWLEAEQVHPSTKFLRFDFIKNDGYTKASQLTKKHELRRQNYCWCGRTIPKPWESKKEYSGG
jgi:predicted adenine nucleotide alpha hydrolase (AANH) superfamily ATPase/ribonuclease HII